MNALDKEALARAYVCVCVCESVCLWDCVLMVIKMYMNY